MIRIAKKHSSYTRLFVFFRPEGLMLCKDQTAKTVVDILVYKTIRCLNFLNEHSLYFKTNKNGFGFFFPKECSELLEKWFNNLIVLIDREVDTKTEVKEVDLSSHFSLLLLESDTPNFNFIFSANVQRVNRKKSLENPL